MPRDFELVAFPSKRSQCVLLRGHHAPSCAHIVSRPCPVITQEGREAARRTPRADELWRTLVSRGDECPKTPAATHGIRRGRKRYPPRGARSKFHDRRR